MKFSIIVLIFCFIGLTSIAKADGTTTPVGTTLTVKCASPTKFTDGSAIPTGTNITIKTYFTKQIPEVGKPVATGTCPFTISTTGMATGQWHAYVTANVAGRPESSLSNSVPFYLLPSLEVAPEPAVLQSVE